MESEGLTLAEMEKILKEYGLSVGKPYNKVPTPSDEYIIPVEGLGISEVRIPYKSSGILGTLRQESGFGIPKNKLKTYIFTGKGIIETNDLYYMSRQILDTGKKVGEALGIDETYYLLRETDYSPFSFKKSFDIDADSFLDAVIVIDSFTDTLLKKYNSEINELEVQIGEDCQKQINDKRTLLT